jgi:RNA-directed DNA polymerase
VEPLATGGSRPQDPAPRNFRQKAMYEELMDQALDPDNVERALQAVIRNQGAPGIDGMTVGQLESQVRQHWAKIQSKLRTGKWVPSPVRRREIPKPNGGVRTLGIPTVMDRFIQQLLLQVMTPIYEPQFQEASYGFRPGRNAHDAVRAARQHAAGGKDWVVDLDITQFFDHVNHDILMGRVGRTIRDKRVLRLIGQYLRAGALVEGVVVMGEAGTPQGGPLSPLLANIYLDALDQELSQRGHAFVRYADDCNIYVSSEAAAQRVYATISAWLSQHLRLQVNAAKSGVGRCWERKFLGFPHHAGETDRDRTGVVGAAEGASPAILERAANGHEH